MSNIFLDDLSHIETIVSLLDDLIDSAIADGYHCDGVTEGTECIRQMIINKLHEMVASSYL